VAVVPLLSEIIGFLKEICEIFQGAKERNRGFYLLFDPNINYIWRFNLGNLKQGDFQADLWGKSMMTNSYKYIIMEANIYAVFV